MQPAVEFRNISKAFGALQANADVSFSIAKC
jgi:simple sugar transport system ATP-binding protein